MKKRKAVAFTLGPMFALAAVLAVASAAILADASHSRPLDFLKHIGAAMRDAAEEAKTEAISLVKKAAKNIAASSCDLRASE